MRSMAIVLVLVSATSYADSPRQLPKRCNADSPTDIPCASFAGTYHLRVLPSDKAKKCFITAPLEADVTIGKPLDKGLAQLDGKALLRKLGWKPRGDDKPEAGAAVRDGVCCVDVRVTETTGKPNDETERRLIVNIARGATIAVAKAEERIMPDKGHDCQNDLDVEVTVVRPK